MTIPKASDVPINTLPNTDAPKGWLTLKKCPKCKKYMRSDGKDIWCEECDGKTEDMRGRNKSWTTEQEQWLKENYKEKEPAELTKHLGRSWGSIKAKAFSLGATKGVKHGTF